ncbi:unnamed protein product, partial [Porites evermanni]
MFAVKTKRRLRAHKSHIIIALLATTDFTVGILIQPATVAWLVVILINYKTEICPFFFLRLLMDSLLDVSLAHVAMISLERYIAVKHPFAYTFVITEIKLLIASAMVWTFSLIIHILWYYTLYLNLFLSITNAFKCFCIVVIVWCNVITVVLLNSVINPILYSIKIREFRVAFIEILCKTANLAKAQEIEMRFFKSPNVVARLEAEHAQGAEELN